MTRFRFVQDHQDTYPVKRLCELVECSRSGFYAWRSRPLSDHYLADVDLAAEIFEIHEASQRTYGTPRILGQLQHRNRRVGRKRVARIMAECGLVGSHGRKKWRRGKKTSASAPAPDLIGRDFTAEASNQRWVADITECAPPLANPFANDTPGSISTRSDQGFRWCRRGDLNPHAHIGH